MTSTGVEYTLAIVKSAAVTRKQTLPILACASLSNLEVMHFHPHHMTRTEAEALYPEHVSKPYWHELLASVQGQDGVVVAVLRGINAVSRWRMLLGATRASAALPGTIRHTYGNGNGADNAAHGSATLVDADRELPIFFGGHFFMTNHGGHGINGTRSLASQQAKVAYNEYTA